MQLLSPGSEWIPEDECGCLSQIWVAWANRGSWYPDKSAAVSLQGLFPRIPLLLWWTRCGLCRTLRSSTSPFRYLLYSSLSMKSCFIRRWLNQSNLVPTSVVLNSTFTIIKWVNLENDDLNHLTNVNVYRNLMAPVYISLMISSSPYLFIWLCNLTIRWWTLSICYRVAEPRK